MTELLTRQSHALVYLSLRRRPTKKRRTDGKQAADVSIGVPMAVCLSLRGCLCTTYRFHTHAK